MTAKTRRNRFSIPVARFRREEKGVAAVEGAVVLAMLSGAFVLMADMSVEAYTQNRLANAMRASIQYIANEGRDLDALDALFKNSYGDQNAVLDKKLNCSCAPSREEFSTGGTGGNGGNGATEEEQKASVQVVQAGAVQEKDGRWGKCDMTCASGPLVKYLELTGSDTVRNIVKNEEVEVDVVYSIRVE